MSVITLQFSTDAESWQSALIRKLSHSPFSHLDYVVPEGLLGASDSPRAPVVEGNPRGVAIRPHDYQHFGIRRRAVVSTTDQIAINFDRLMRSQVNKPFDSEAINQFFSDDPFDRAWRDSDKWFCSELVTWALEGAGFWPFELLMPKNRVSPPDLLLLLNPWMNTKTFWDRIPDLKMGPKEK